MKLLSVHSLEIQLEHCGQEYFVSRYFIIYNYNLCKLKHPIVNMDGNGSLWSYPLSMYLINKPIGLFKFDDLEGYVFYNCLITDRVFRVNNLDLYFSIRMHFFVLEG